jgi:putative ABC transport system permease protein
MLKNYLLTAFRNLYRHKSHAVINTLGLAIGIAACLLLFLVVHFETSFDDFHPKRASIYRIGTESRREDGITYTDGVAFPVADGIRLDFPQIKEVASIFLNGGQVTIDNGNGPAKKFIEDNFYYADPEFFKMFNFGWLAGDPASALKNINSVVLTQATAEKYFGDWRSAIGKTIKLDNRTLYKVTGILQNVPANTDFPLAAVVPHTAIANTGLAGNLHDWVSDFGGAYTFVVLPPDLPVTKFNTQLRDFAKRHKPAHYAISAPFAQPLSEMHYDDRFGNFTGHTFSHALVNALSLIGIFLLVIACVNFINLSTAQAANRAKEVGVRKVLGSRRSQLAFQFLGETALLTIFAVILATAIARLTLPFLNQLLETKITMDLFSSPLLIGLILAIILLVTFLSGTYPAIILSGFNPITALKSRISAKSAGGITLRRTLVVLQFSIAQFLIIGMLIVVSQMDYFKNASLGFNKAAVIHTSIPDDSASRSRLGNIRNSLLQNPDIKEVSFCFGAPSSENDWNSDFKFDHSASKTNFQANLKWADTAWFRLFDIQFVAGRPFHSSDTIREFVVNETLLGKLGIRNPQDALGKEINLWDHFKGNIVGVVKDFNVYSLQKAMTPVAISTWQQFYQSLNIKIRPGTEKSSLAYIEKVWTSAFPDYVYQYKFLDETIANFYKQEAQLSTLYKIFAGIAIFISCLGLYGLVAFMAVQRTKEMGIRKVLGASARNIVYLLSKEFTLLILIAFILAAPLAYYIMHGWLMNYHYRIQLGASIFLLAISGSVIIAWITVGHRAIQAALANPVKSLRTE